MKNILLIGNITFHDFTPRENFLFQSNKTKRALIHELHSVQIYDDVETAIQNGDDAESYLLFPLYDGEVVFENDADRIKCLNDIKSLVPIDSIYRNSVLCLALKLKLFYLMNNIGKVKYTINSNNGKAINTDGSRFFGIHCFSNKVKLNKKIKEMLKSGYVEY